MEEIYLGGVTGVRPVKIWKMFHSSAGAGQLGFMGRCHQRRNQEDGPFGETNLDKPGALMANTP